MTIPITTFQLYTTMLSSSVGKVSEIAVNTTCKEIHIRVLRKWIWYNKKEELSYIFVDAHGDAIEAITNSAHQDHFDRIINVQCCYAVSKYISTEARRQMRVVPHKASIKFGLKATFTPINDTTIPTFYYDFASYTSLTERIHDPKNPAPSTEIKPLTDYIGRIEHIGNEIPRKNKRLRKVTILDTSKNNIEITFWEEKSNLITDQNAVGKILAVSSTIVTFFRDLQLESTSATAVSINPPIPDLQQYINRFKEIGDAPTTFHSQPIITLAQMLQKNPESTTQNKGACNVTLADFDYDKTWAYVNCNNCNQRAHLHDNSKFVCLDHWDDYGVKCMYCVNTIIKDNETTAKAVFFDEAMTDMLETTCEEMIMKRGYKDTKVIPNEIIALQGQQCQLQMTIKKDKSMAINRAKKLFENPPTPAKTTGMKRPPPDSPDSHYHINKAKV